MSNIIINPTPEMKFVDYREPIWGDSFNWSFARSLSQVTKITIHHSVTTPDATPQDIALLHKARGWGGIGYHLVITKDGTIYYCGDIGTGRAAVTNNNEKTIAILLVGTFMNGVEPTDAQKKSCKQLCEFFMTKMPALNNINTWDDVIGHQECIKIWPTATSTECPGDHWKGDASAVYNDIKGATVTPTPNPTPTPPKPPVNPGSFPNDGLYRVVQNSKQLGAYKRNPLDYIKEIEKKINDAQSVAYGSDSDANKVKKLRDILKN